MDQGGEVGAVEQADDVLAVTDGEGAAGAFRRLLLECALEQRVARLRLATVALWPLLAEL